MSSIIFSIEFLLIFDLYGEKYMYIFYYYIINNLNMIRVLFIFYCLKEVFRLINIFIRCFRVKFWKFLFLF